MKKHVILIIALLSVSTFASAQIQKGNSVIGLSFGSDNNSSKSSSISGGEVNSNYKSLNLSVDYAYFLKDKQAVGVVLSYGTFNYGNDSLNFEERKTYGLNIFGKQYFMFSDKIGAFGSVNIGGGSSMSEFDSNEYSSKGWNIGAGFGGGIAFFPWKKLSLEAGLAAVNLGYNTNTTKILNNPDNIKTEQSSSNFGFNFARSLSNIQFTIRYHFGFKK